MLWWINISWVDLCFFILFAVICNFVYTVLQCLIRGFGNLGLMGCGHDLFNSWEDDEWIGNMCVASSHSVCGYKDQ